MKRRTGLLSTRDWMRSWVEEDTTSSESDILSGVVVTNVLVNGICFVETAAAAAAGEKAVVHEADDRRAVAKMIGRIMAAVVSKEGK